MQKAARSRLKHTTQSPVLCRLLSSASSSPLTSTVLSRMLSETPALSPTVIKSDDDLKGAVPLTHSLCFVVKLHGDYLDTRIRNTDRELSSYSAETDALLDRIIDEHGLIICGWSAEWDTALKAAIARAPNRRYPLFWAARGPLTKTAEDLISHRAGRVISIEGADSFFEKLEEMVSVQADLERPNPRSTELLVGSTKKYLGRPEFRIQLDELIGAETRHITKRWQPRSSTRTELGHETITSTRLPVMRPLLSPLPEFLVYSAAGGPETSSCWPAKSSSGLETST
jgi:hypothetical protein